MATQRDAQLREILPIPDYDKSWKLADIEPLK